MTHMSRLDVYATLRKECVAAGGQSKWAQRNHISTAYISDVLNGRKDPGPLILNALNLRPLTVYVAKGAQHAE